MFKNYQSGEWGSVWTKIKFSGAEERNWYKMKKYDLE